MIKFNLKFVLLTRIFPFAQSWKLFCHFVILLFCRPATRIGTALYICSIVEAQYESYYTVASHIEARLCHHRNPEKCINCKHSEPTHQRITCVSVCKDSTR